MKPDPVNRPTHYTRGRFETIEVIEDWGLGFNLGNVVKYVSRAGHKDPAKTIEDLEKAHWYLEREIGLLRQAQAELAEMSPVMPVAYDDVIQPFRDALARDDAEYRALVENHADGCDAWSGEGCSHEPGCKEQP